MLVQVLRSQVQLNPNFTALLVQIKFVAIKGLSLYQIMDSMHSKDIQKICSFTYVILDELAVFLMASRLV